MLIRYTSDAERVRACHGREETITAVAKSLDRIITAHRHMVCIENGQSRSMPVACRPVDAALVADVLNFVIAEILHNAAEQDFLFGKEMREADDETHEQTGH